MPEDADRNVGGRPRKNLTITEFEEWKAQQDGVIGSAMARIEELEMKVGRLAISAPAVLRKLDLDAVKKAVELDPYAEFEVLETWQNPGIRDHLPSSRRIRADHYPLLLDYVRAGLKLGIPESQEDVVARIKQQANIKQQAVEKEVKARVAASLDEALRKAEAAGVKST